VNPYQDVIDWLQSPEGCKWSSQRLIDGRHASGYSFTLINYGPGDVLWMGGIMSVKEDRCPPGYCSFCERKTEVC